VAGFGAPLDGSEPAAQHIAIEDATLTVDLETLIRLATCASDEDHRQVAPRIPTGITGVDPPSRSDSNENSAPPPSSTRQSPPFAGTPPRWKHELRQHGVTMPPNSAAYSRVCRESKVGMRATPHPEPPNRGFSGPRCGSAATACWVDNDPAPVSYGDPCLSFGASPRWGIIRLLHVAPATAARRRLVCRVACRCGAIEPRP
jgi:hypothetical protein